MIILIYKQYIYKEVLLMDILGCQVSNQNVKVLGDYCFYLSTQKSAKEILFNYFLELYDVEEVLDSRLMF